MISKLTSFQFCETAEDIFANCRVALVMHGH